ncbi:sporulation protein, YlmC/YmxH family [Bhargavaea ginsengi]|uniref:Sporulation protein, YlmC/YmxH family n=1 Tax=Bhargavaea ginsengi TaxID=426757 RepID=A0A1H6T6L4_9BACL|nr:YlmC/YmxH family sporulation protein [Bhargavaea ginsengi]MCM3087347.1 YlmC/YmxH family sporulation protein [Bhargavaea ginsengi]SEI71875.1 sporulation protein, YlmC/YmxH family [Bhargavaea ginsengi]
MKFSDLQKKEFIEAGRGRQLGFAVDATISTEDGTIEYFHVGGMEKIRLFGNGEAPVKVPLRRVMVIGKDVVLVDDAAKE